MKVYISNFSRYKGDHGVAISNSIPSWYGHCRKYIQLVPKWSMVEKWNSVKNSSNDEKQVVIKEYRKYYKDLLDTVKPENFVKDGDVLLCWCGKGNFCHRYILAEYLQEKGINVVEV